METNFVLADETIQTPRLVLRAFRQLDLDDLYAYASVAGVGEMAGWQHHESLLESQKVLTNFMEQKDVLAIEYQQHVIGSIGLHNSPDAKSSPFQQLRIRELGYVLSKTYWGKGIMPEAAEALITRMFSCDLLDAITVGHFNENQQSASVIQKLSFTPYRRGVYHAKQLNRIFLTTRYVRYRNNVNHPSV